MTKTENYRLSQWDKTDLIKMDDFNEDNRKVDAALMGVIPKGLICMWSGAQDAIPKGWVLCDGDNGTPDLRGRFVLGASDSHAVGSKGGEETHVLTEAEMPSHSHTVTIRGGAAGTGTYGAASADYRNMHSDTTSSSGSGSAHNNMPPYWALCYIMKT